MQKSLIFSLLIFLPGIAFAGMPVVPRAVSLSKVGKSAGRIGQALDGSNKYNHYLQLSKTSDDPDTSKLHVSESWFYKIELSQQAIFVHFSF